jgi:hypothetical protein
MCLRPGNRDFVDNYQKKRPLDGSSWIGVVVSCLANGLAVAGSGSQNRVNYSGPNSCSIRFAHNLCCSGSYKSRFIGSLRLLEGFKKWRNKEIDGFELNDLIHKHHQGPSRDLWKYYAYADPDTAVARAVNLDLIKNEEIPDDILKLITPRFDLFRDNEP